MSRRIPNIILSIVIIGANLYYFPLTVQIIRSGGGSWGFGILALPFTIVINLLLIPGIVFLFSKYEKKKGLLLTNIIGTIGIASLSYLIYTIPESKQENNYSNTTILQENEDSVADNPLLELDTIDPIAKTEIVEQELEDDCVFNNDIKGLSIEALTKFDSTLNYNWNNERMELTAVFSTDTLYLSIGGCYHFNFIAGLRTNNKNFEDTAYWFNKAKWLATSFFWNSIGEDYTNAIDNDLLIKRGYNTLNEVHYNFPPDTTLTNMYNTGVTISRNSNGTIVEIGTYVN